MNMKKHVLKGVVAGALSMAVPAAFATVSVELDLDGNGVGPTQTIDVMDWAPGNALAVGAVPITAIGQTFDLLYQAKLGNLQLGGANLAGPTQEFTITLGMGERVTAVAGSTVLFAHDPAGATNFFEVWAGGAAANDLTGEGFNDGVLVMSGVITGNDSSFTILPDNPVLLDQNSNGDQWGGQLTVAGIGVTALQTSLAAGFVNPLYFPNSVPVPEFNMTFFNTSQVLPFREVDPSSCFVNDGGGTGNSACDGTAFVADATGTNPNLGAINGLFLGGATPEDFIFQADSNMSFDNVVDVPEPATLALFGLGLLGMGGLGRKRKSA